MRARKCWWCSASANDVMDDVCIFFHGGRVGSTRRSASSSLMPVCWHRALSLTETGRRTAVWRWWCCRMILLAVLPRVLSGRFLSHMIITGHSDDVVAVICWLQPPSSPHGCSAGLQDTFSHIHFAKHPTSSMLVPTQTHIPVSHSLNENELRTCTPLIKIFCAPMKYYGGI